jgi:hypothetical protein
VDKMATAVVCPASLKFWTFPGDRVRGTVTI